METGVRKPIEPIQVGEMVLARNEFEPHGPLELKRVEAKHVRTTLRITLLFYCSILSYSRAALHPFYVPAREAFVPARELQVGDQLISHDGQLLRIDAIHSTLQIATVYNLRVADYHTYFVGCDEWGFSVWAHNAYDEMRATLPGVSERVAQRAYQHATTGPAATRWQRFRDYLRRNGVTDLDQRRVAFDNALATGPAHSPIQAAQLRQHLADQPQANFRANHGPANPYIPMNPDGTPVPLARHPGDADMPLPDPAAQGSHTVLGGRVGTSDGVLYRQSATFYHEGFDHGTFNGHRVPAMEVDWHNHSRPWDHSNPHYHQWLWNGQTWGRGPQRIFHVTNG